MRALSRWTIRLVVPSHLADTVGVFETAWREEFASLLRPSTADDLSWYFEARWQLEQRPGATDGGLEHTRYARARDAFGAPRYRVPYRTWMRQGPTCFESLSRRSWRTRLLDRRGGSRRMCCRSPTCIWLPWSQRREAEEGDKRGDNGPRLNCPLNGPSTFDHSVGCHDAIGSNDIVGNLLEGC